MDQNDAVAISQGGYSLLPITATVAMQRTVMKVTPAMAQDWLSSRLPNRPVDKNHVKDFVSRMRSGTFTPELAQVKFNTETPPRLGDGQHKLTAVIDFGAPVDMEIWTNVPDSVLEQVDDCAKVRTLSDKFAMYNTDIDNNEDAAAIVRRIECVKQKRQTVKMDHTTAASVYYTNKEAIDYVNNALLDRSSRELNLVGVKAALVMAWKKNPTLIKKFIEEYVEGAGNSSINPAHVLNRTVKGDYNGIKKAPAQSVTKTLQALRLYLNGDTIVRLRELKTKSQSEIIEDFLTTFSSEAI